MIILGNVKVRMDTLRLTSVGAPIGADVSEVDDMFLVESLDKGSKLVPSDPAYRHYECAYPRRRDGYQRIEAHGGIGFDSFRRLQGATVCALDIGIASGKMGQAVSEADKLVVAAWLCSFFCCKYY